uniref:Transmembrane protein n=1 Tax=Kalanchoe fedtschenkoi TaxID=63787 RepID=A0A7N0V5F8_KALFE
MAKKLPEIDTPWILQALPILLVVLVAAHVLALAYWIYRLATDNKRSVNKRH